MKRKIVILLFLFPNLFGGCKAPGTSVSVPAPVALVAPVQAVVDTVAADTFLLPDTLRLTDALRAAMLYHPGLSVYAREVGVWEAEALQASLFPNPELSLEMENFAGGKTYHGFEAAEITVTAGQLLRVAGKRRKEVAVARLSGQQAGWEYQEALLRVFTEVTRAFYDVWVLQEQVHQAERLVELSHDLEQAVARRVRAGAMSPAAEARARIEKEKAGMELQDFRYRLGAARQRLALFWGEGKDSFRAVKGGIRLPDTLPSLGDLLALLEGNPALARLETEKELRRARLALARAARFPDPYVSAGYRRLGETATQAFVAGIAIPLPLFDRNQGEITKATLRLEQAEMMRQQMKMDLAKELSRNYGELLSLLYRAKRLERSVIPEAERSMRVIRSGYREGRFAFLDVLDAQRTLFSAYTEYLEILVRCREKISDIEMLTGTPLAGMKGAENRTVQ